MYIYICMAWRGRVEEFYDLSLNVKGFRGVAESLRNYVERERLDGDNKARPPPPAPTRARASPSARGCATRAAAPSSAPLPPPPAAARVASAAPSVSPRRRAG